DPTGPTFSPIDRGPTTVRPPIARKRRLASHIFISRRHYRNAKGHKRGKRREINARLGFGVDSIIESFSGASLLWRLQSHETGERREQLALKLVGISFFVLAAYVAVDAVKTLVQREPPH